MKVLFLINRCLRKGEVQGPNNLLVGRRIKWPGCVVFLEGHFTLTVPVASH